MRCQGDKDEAMGSAWGCPHCTPVLHMAMMAADAAGCWGFKNVVGNIND